MSYWQLPRSDVAHLYRECIGKNARDAVRVYRNHKQPVCRRCEARRVAAEKAS